MHKVIRVNLLVATLLGAGLVPGMAKAGSELQFKNQVLNTNAGAARSSLFRSLKTNEETRIFVLQFKTVIGLTEQNWLKTSGVEVLRYVPDDAYIVRIADQSVLPQISQDQRVQILLPYAAELRLNSKSLLLSVLNKDQTRELHVRAFKGENFESIRLELSSVPGLQILAQTEGSYVVEAPLASAENIAKIEGVEWVDLYHRPQINKLDQKALLGAMAKDLGVTVNTSSKTLEDLTGFESGTKIMKFESVWGQGYKGEGEVITVADTGLDTGDMTTLNQDFKGLKRTIIGGYFSKTWGDPEGHGTHVAGSAVGRGHSSDGRIKGGAPGASLVVEAMWSQAMKTLTIPPDPSKLFETAYTRDNSRIHTNSWGSNAAGEYDDAARAVDEFMWNQPDMVILFAAGNSGVDGNKDGRVDGGSVTSPGTAKNIISVGASENLIESGGIQVELGTIGNEQDGFAWPVEPLASDKLSNNQNGLAAFSSRGPTQDGRLKPDLVAPGTNILSSCSKFTGAGDLWGKFNESLCYSGGTSMSTPLVAGAAAVVRQYLIQKRKITSPSASLVKAVLMHSAFDMYPGQFGAIGVARGQELAVPGPNSDQGYGRVDVEAATSAVLGLHDEYTGLATGEEKKFPLLGSVKKVTLVYTDAAGTTSAQKALVNDLDIQVHVGDRFYEKASRVDNSEQIILPTAMSGAVLVVKAKNVPMGQAGRQPYSVVYSR